MKDCRSHYAKYVTGGGDGPTVLKERAADLGYDADFVPESISENPKLFQASCGSGCPLRLALATEKGDGVGFLSSSDDKKTDVEDDEECFIIMDIGCGAGHDVLLANHILQIECSKNKGPKKNYKVIGIDLTPEMIEAANQNWNQQYDPNSGQSPYVEFIEMNIENPSSEFLSRFTDKVDLVISNGVLNLCRNKLQVFQNAEKLLKPNGRGRFVFSDVMKLTENDINPEAKIATSINGDVFSS